MDHIISAARRRAVLAIAQQQAQVRQDAEKALAELGDALNELRDFYVEAAGLDGEWQFGQNERGEVVLRPVEKPEPETPADEAGADRESTRDEYSRPSTPQEP